MGKKLNIQSECSIPLGGGSILLFKQGETNSAIIANKVGCATGYVNAVKNDLRPARLSAVEQRSLEVPMTTSRIKPLACLVLEMQPSSFFHHGS